MKAKTTFRGYGWNHQKMRQIVQLEVAAGIAVCTRCGLRIDPGEPWDLGHDDYDRAIYIGPEHRACNRATASRRRRTSRRYEAVHSVRLTESGSVLRNV
jgi:hypothetical protein